jgi:hypothetical protein
MLRPYGAARVVMSWRRNRAAIELKVDRTKTRARRFPFSLIQPSAEADDETASETLAAPSPRVRGEGGVRGRHRCLSVAGDR